MQNHRLVVGIGLVLAGLGAALPLRAQLPFTAFKSSGQSVTPVFEGWYRNQDGTFSLSFGYFNRNSEEVLEIPIGPDNFVEPGNQNQGQPTEFQPRRHWGVFAVKVPADFGLKELVWTLRSRGATFSIPGSLHPNWQIDALEGEAGSGNTPPVLRFAENGPDGRGPLGLTAGPLAAGVGQPVPLSVWGRDDGRTAGSVSSDGKSGTPLTLTWFKHQGPGKVTFSDPASKVSATGGQATTTATFSEPGEYVVRVRANDASGVANAGHAQCCWTNGFVKVAVSASGERTAAARVPPERVTFARHVAPILQKKCQVCHQPNSIGPMPLVTYEDAREFARPIKTRVAARIMPPWHIDKNVGIREFKNDRSLTDAEIATIVSWVDGGAPRGDPKDLPPPARFPDPTGWQLAEEFGPPDLVIKSPPYTLPARTQDKWFRPVTDTGLTEPRWVRAIEIKPSYPDGRRIVHHVLTMLEQPEDGITGLAHSAHDVQTSAGLFMEWAVGKVGEVFPADAGKLLLPGARIRWEIHMFAVGREIRDNQVELGVYLYPKGVVPKHRTVLRMFDVSRGLQLDIPPGDTAMTQNFYVMQAPARLENFQPHMHMRGRSMSLEAIYPDGRKEVLSVVNNFQWNWHVNYIYADHVAPLLPKGTVLVFTAWHDNTPANLLNPDPKQWVGWGDRTVDEMAHAWVDVTYFEQEEFEQLVAARKARGTSTRRQ